jgi:hypothetical protein
MKNVKGVVRVLFVSLALSPCSNLAFSAAPPPAPPTPADPCQSPNVAKLSVPFQFTPGTFELVAASSRPIYICGFVVSVSGGGEFQFAYGSSCGAAAIPPLTALTGQIPGISGSVIPYSYSGPGTIFSVPAENAFCLVGDTGVSGVLTYTQP